MLLASNGTPPQTYNRVLLQHPGKFFLKKSEKQKEHIDTR